MVRIVGRLDSDPTRGDQERQRARSSWGVTGSCQGKSDDGSGRVRCLLGTSRSHGLRRFVGRMGSGRMDASREVGTV